MADPVLFYFDFSSPYGFLASEIIDEAAGKHGRHVTWRPTLLGAVFKVTGQGPLAEAPLKGAYMQRDMPRTARRVGVTVTFPDVFPFSAVSASRAFYALDAEGRMDEAKALAHALYRSAWVAGVAPAKPPQIAEIAAGIGLDGAALVEAMAAPAVKERLRTEVDAAITAGVFGSPYFVADGEPFWGVDKLPELEHWLETGGW